MTRGAAGTTLLLAALAATGTATGAAIGHAAAQTAPAPGTSTSGTSTSGTSTSGTTAPDSWVRKTTAELTVLDKVRAQASQITVPVGQSATFHSLTIKVLGCAVRPPDQAPDATAFVEITDSAPGGPGLRGWILANTPSLNMLQHPIYDVRVAGCK